MPGEEPHNSHANGPLKPYFSGGGEDSTASYANTDVAIGTAIGPFKVCGILGEGGYGIVYLAEQERPIRRRVALKVIKPGMDSRQVIARFEAERQALAVLDHPNIAHIHDAATTSGGRPYFAMEYIEGLPVTEYCDREKLDLKDRLRLFVQVCDAVQHAHQKAIIHRDLKPSNILVTTGEGKPLVKVIDFGIAKALSQPLTERTLHTENSQFIGTPDYMSPEQAEMDNGGIDTRSDVYSLGVVLYELLTGVLPFDSQELRAGGVEQVRRMIRQQEPLTPSTRLAYTGGALTRIAQCRRTDPQALKRSLRRELEWIPLKAMRKESSRRYQSISELADDIENYLKGVPLHAGPESFLYRARKFVQRHAGAVAAVIIVVASLIIGLTVSTVMYARAERMRLAAQASQTAEAAQRQTAEQERNRAVQAEEEATRRLVDLYQQQGRKYMEQGDLDRALVLLVEAMKKDNRRVSTWLLTQECLRMHPDPNLHVLTGPVPWKGKVTEQGVSYAVSPDRRLIAFADEGDGAVRVFDTETAEPKIALETCNVSKLAFIPGNRYLLTCNDDNSSHHLINVFDLTTGGRVTSIRRVNADIEKVLTFRQGALPSGSLIEKHYRGILMSPDGGWFAFLDLDDSGPNLESWVSLWDFSGNKLHVAERHGPQSMLFGVAYRPLSGYGVEAVLFALDCRSYLWLWKVPCLEPEQGFEWDAVDGIVSSVRTVGQSRNGDLYLLDRETNRLIRLFPHILAFGVNHDASQLVTQTWSSSTREPSETATNLSADLWDTKEGRHITQLSDEVLANWHFAPDGKCLITEHGNAEIRVWSSTSGSRMFTVPSEANQEVVDVSPDSQWLLTVDRKTRSVVNMWTLSTGECFKPYVADPACRDIGIGWLIEESDRVFSCSQHVPGLLSQLNASGSAVICRAGLLPVSTDSTRAEEISYAVAHRIPLRFQDGRIRPASEKEMRLAAIEYHAQMGGQGTPEAVESLLELVSYALDQNDLTEASGFMSRYSQLPGVRSVQIVQCAQELKDRLSGAYRALGDREERCGRYAAAVSNYIQALRFRDNDPRTLCRLAWVLSTCPEQEILDSRRAVADSARACDLTMWRDWECLSIYATACGANGAFAEAVRWQEKAIESLPRSVEAQWSENLFTRLRLFRSQRPYDRRRFYNVPGGNLLCWWKLDDFDGNVVRDRSGRGHTATVVRDVQQVTDNGLTVLQFYGREASVRCPNAADLNVRDALTVAAWVKYKAIQGPDGQFQQAVGKGRAWTLSVMGHKLIFDCQGLDVPGAAPSSRSIGKTSLDDNRWHQIAAVYDSHALTLYVDGQLDATEAASGLLLLDGDGIVLGQGIDYVTGWQDLMRDVRIYDRALDAEEIIELYEATR